MISARLLEQVKRHEGWRPSAYRCPAGKLSIGYGHNLEANPVACDIVVRSPIDRSFGERMLIEDLERTEHVLTKTWPHFANLRGARREAMINMAFNLGVAGLMKFRATLRAIEQGDFEEAAAEMLDSRWAEQVGDRARELAQIMRMGHYPDTAEA